MKLFSDLHQGDLLIALDSQQTEILFLHTQYPAVGFKKNQTFSQYCSGLLINCTCSWSSEQTLHDNVVIVKPFNSQDAGNDH